MSDCKLRAKNCGGCPLLGLDYAAQLKQKESAVRALLGKYGPVPVSYTHLTLPTIQSV